MEAEHGVEAFKEGLKLGPPEICNADQGAQFTSESWVTCMQSNGVQISHVGVGRCIDNVRIERFWWTIKYEDIHLKSYESVSEARAGIADFIHFYNEERPHQALGYKTPYEKYFGKKPRQIVVPQELLLGSKTGCIKDLPTALNFPQDQQPTPCLLAMGAKAGGGLLICG